MHSTGKQGQNDHDHDDKEDDHHNDDRADDGTGNEAEHNNMSGIRNHRKSWPKR